MGKLGLGAARLAAISVTALAIGVVTLSAASQATEERAQEPGMDVETVDVAGEKADVMVYRGRLEPRPPNPYVVKSSLEEERKGLTQLGGGETVWFIDEEDGTLRGCRLIQTADAGRRAVRCWSRGTQN